MTYFKAAEIGAASLAGIALDMVTTRPLIGLMRYAINKSKPEPTPKMA